MTRHDQAPEPRNAGVVAHELQKCGYAHALVVGEGILEWHRRGYLVVTAPGVEPARCKPELAAAALDGGLPPQGPRAPASRGPVEPASITKASSRSRDGHEVQTRNSAPCLAL